MRAPLSCSDCKENTANAECTLNRPGRTFYSGRAREFSKGDISIAADFRCWKSKPETTKDTKYH